MLRPAGCQRQAAMGVKTPARRRQTGERLLGTHWVSSRLDLQKWAAFRGVAGVGMCSRPKLLLSYKLLYACINRGREQVIWPGQQTVDYLANQRLSASVHALHRSNDDGMPAMTSGAWPVIFSMSTVIQPGSLSAVSNISTCALHLSQTRRSNFSTAIGLRLLSQQSCPIGQDLKVGLVVSTKNTLHKLPNQQPLHLLRV
jgi:hypothetical protein